MSLKIVLNKNGLVLGRLIEMSSKELVVRVSPSHVKRIPLNLNKYSIVKES